MDQSQLAVTVRQQDHVAVLDLRGQIDGFAEPELAAAYAAAEQANPAAILLNFAEVQYINSTGIALIIELLAKARAAGRELLASGLSKHYVEIFQITRLADFVRIVDDIVESEKRAIDEAGQPAR